MECCSNSTLSIFSKYVNIYFGCILKLIICAKIFVNKYNIFDEIEEDISISFILCF